MPELPEVERFRQILSTLVNANTDEKQPLKLELHGEKPPRKWISAQEIGLISGHFYCESVFRKGKLLWMVLIENTMKRKKSEDSEKRCYLFLHMGMTGRLVSPDMSCSWGNKYIKHDEEAKFPPKYTYLILKSGKNKVAFADPRKFGSVSLCDNLATAEELAPDGLDETNSESNHLEEIISCVSNQRLGIKALLLDQKRVVSGVGNWVADEVLYQCGIHPDQQNLTEEQACKIVKKLNLILSTAVVCLNQYKAYPETWLFSYRWTKKKAGKDYKGRSLTFLQSGGRTSAIVASIQKLRKSQGKEIKNNSKVSRKRKSVSRPDGPQPHLKKKDKSIVTSNPNRAKATKKLPESHDTKRRKDVSSGINGTLKLRRSLRLANIGDENKQVEIA